MFIIQIIDMNLEVVKKEIMQLMVLVAQNKKEEAENSIEMLLEKINEGLDFAKSDEELINWSKFAKIVEELKQKIA